MTAREMAPEQVTPGIAVSAGQSLAQADIDRSRFEDRIAPLMPDLLRYFARRVTPRDDAYDCLSETLIVLWRGHSKLPEDGAELRAWSFGVARKVLANHWRGQSRRAALAGRMSPPPSVTNDLGILEALDSLSSRDRELVQLIIWDGFGVAEAGALLGLGAATSRTRYARAKSRLRASLG